VRTTASAGHREAGSAIVEFLLVPVVYLVLVLGSVQSAAFAVDGAAREAVRAFVTAPDDGAATERVLAAVGLALRDQGLDQDPSEVLTVRCEDPCRAPGTTVTVDVSVDVTLPGVPRWLSGAVPLSVPVSATATGVVDSYVGRG
jgi:hypothetical protein